MRYARVHVDIAAKGLDRGFDYYIPDDYPCAVVPGLCVSVRFGPRTLEGLVTDVMDRTDVPMEKLRALGPPRLEGRAVSPELMELAKWMANRWHCPVSQALRPILPPGARADKARAVTRMCPELAVTKEAAQLFIDTCSTRFSRQIALVSLLLQDAELSRITQELPGWRQSAKALEKKGIVRIVVQTVERMPYENITAVEQTPVVLTEAQCSAVSRIQSAVAAGAGEFYLFGVTGSGKTEVYLRCADYAMQRDKGTIILVPEIALTPQMVQRFRDRFGDSVSVLHSALSLAERRDQWARIRTGQVRVAVGARSAVFAPFDHIGLIIVDEEHETSYCAEHAPRYDAVEVARKRCQMHGATLVLGSATPSIGRYRDALTGRMELLVLPNRVRGLSMPEVTIVDMRQELQKGNRTMFSDALREELKKTIWNGEQAVLFLNRRGYHTFVSCRDCGEAIKCPNCDVALTYHNAGSKLTCHYCGHEQFPPSVCPHCASKRIRYFGAGTQRIEDELQALFPGVKCLRMDRDTTQKKDSHEKIFSAFAKGEAQILLGTQMVAKGLDFPNITLVGVMSADTALHTPDYAGAERAFQLVAQVAGRAGRGSKPGRVVVQTYCPEEPAITLAAQHDYPAFYDMEIKRREQGDFPPFARFIRFLFADESEKKCAESAKAFFDALQKKMDDMPLMRENLLHISCGAASVAKIEQKYRNQVLLKLPENEHTQDLVQKLMDFDDAYAHTGVLPTMEINPRNMI